MQRFQEYRDSLGRTVGFTYLYTVTIQLRIFPQILPGNQDTFTVEKNVLNPPIVASAIRILPYSNHSRTVCLRMGIKGCPFTGEFFTTNFLGVCGFKLLLFCTLHSQCSQRCSCIRYVLSFCKTKHKLS